MAITAEGKKKTLIPMLAATLCSVLLLACLFLPLLSATPAYERELEWASDYEEEEFEYETGMELDDLEELSFFNFTRLAAYFAEEEPGMEGFEIFFYVLFGILALFSLLCLLFSLLRKGVPTLIFSIFAFLFFLLIAWIFGESVVGRSYNWGIAYYLFFVAAIGTFATSIWLIAVKSKYKVRSGPLPPAYQPMEPRYQPQYQAPQYQAPQYQAPQYQAPQYQPPQAPQYQPPQAPQYQPPQAPEASQAPEQDPQN